MPQKTRVARIARLSRIAGLSRLRLFVRCFRAGWRAARALDTSPLPALDPWDNRPPLPALAGCTHAQREMMQIALDYGLVAHCLTPRTAQSASVHLYVASAVGLGHPHVCAPQPDYPEYRLGMERVVRVEGRKRRVICECPAGKRGEPCAHAGATWLQVLGAGVEVPSPCAGAGSAAHVE